MSENNYLSLKDILNEGLVRDLIIFVFLYVLVISQEWSNWLLPIFPLVSFAFSLFFKVIASNKWRTEFNPNVLIYNPLGSEKKNADRLLFCSLLQLILLFWIGAESFYHPQLIDNYALFFLSVFCFLYTFGFFWLFTDIWRHARTQVIFNDLKYEEAKLNQKNLDKVLANLKIKRFKLISIVNLIIFLTLNALNILLVLLQSLLPAFAFDYPLPGTGIEDSAPIQLHYLIYVILIASPALAIMFLALAYRDISAFNESKLTEILAGLPRQIQIKITENLKTLNSHYRKALSTE